MMPANAAHGALWIAQPDEPGSYLRDASRSKRVGLPGSSHREAPLSLLRLPPLRLEIDPVVRRNRPQDQWSGLARTTRLKCRRFGSTGSNRRSSNCWDALAREEAAVAVLPPRLTADTEQARAAINPTEAGAAGTTAAGIPVYETLVTTADRVILRHTDRDATRVTAPPPVLTLLSPATTPVTTAIPAASGPAPRETTIPVLRALPAEASAAAPFPIPPVPFPRADFVGEDAVHRGDGTT